MWKLLGCMLFSVVFLLSGCTSTRYYAQAVKGQADITIRSRSIERLIQHPDTTQELSSRLLVARRIVSFANESLHLPHNGSYQKYADLKREHVVWNVVAAGEFSISPKVWCFPFAGCLGYRGYFSEQQALSQANSLREDGLDVFVSGVDAYSTLGFLNDPLLNTFLDYSEPELAGLIFHELTHQRIYIKDDFIFNESLATAVELYGVERWLQTEQMGTQFANYQKRYKYRLGIVDAMLETKAKLENLFDSTKSNDEKREAKQHIFARLRENLEDLVLEFNGSTRWLEQLVLNNAVITSYATYYDYVPVFQKLLEQNAGDLKTFFLFVEGLKKMTSSERADWFAARME